MALVLAVAGVLVDAVVAQVVVETASVSAAFADSVGPVGPARLAETLAASIAVVDLASTSAASERAGEVVENTGIGWAVGPDAELLVSVGRHGMCRFEAFAYKSSRSVHLVLDSFRADVQLAADVAAQDSSLDGG